MLKHRLALALAAISLSAIAIASLAFVPPLATWTVGFDDPPKDGVHKTEVTITYTDPLGKQITKLIEVKVDVKGAWTGTQKREAIVAKLDAALADPLNKVDGHALASTGFLAEAMLVTPAANPPGNPPGNPPAFTGAKIKRINTRDNTTREIDRITDPNAHALGSVEALGDITGKDPDNTTSAFSVGTNAGTVTVALNPNMTRLELLDQLASGLQGLGAHVWVDSERMTLFVLIDGETIGSLGAGSSDIGLTAVASVLAE